MNTQKISASMTGLLFLIFTISFTPAFAEQVSMAAETLQPTESLDTQKTSGEDAAPAVINPGLPLSLETVSPLEEPAVQEPLETFGVSVSTSQNDLKETELRKKIEQALNSRSWDNESSKTIHANHYPKPGDKINVTTITKILKFKDLTILERGIPKTIKIPDGHIEIPKTIAGTVLTSEFKQGIDKAGTVRMTLDVDGNGTADSEVYFILDGKGGFQVESDPIKK